MTPVAASAGRADTARHMQPADAGNPDDTDEALMLAYGRGDAAAFERLYARHKGPTYRYLLRHTSERPVADELHQDVWMSVVRARERYAANARFKTWVYTLARHRLIDHWRARRGARFTSLDDDGAVETVDAQLAAESGDKRGGDPLSTTIDAQAGQRLVVALADVPAAQRDAFLLHIEAGLSLEEIARLTGAPPETIKSRLRYAYRRLRAALEDLQ
jgi:RNA polymerase sigma-70 factor (ECF subfamily)